METYADRDGHIWINGRWQEWRQAQLHVLSHGLHYSSVVFEGLRSYRGKIFALDQHIKRLFASARAFDMTIPFTERALTGASEELLRRNGTQNAYLRPLVWRGSEAMGIKAQATTINVAIASWELPGGPARSSSSPGISLQISQWRRAPSSSFPSEAKASCQYVVSTLAKHAAEASGFDDALLLDWRGLIAESTGANIFFVIDGALHTPFPDCFLNGITRQTIILLARRRGIAVIERAIQPSDIMLAQECFLTGTASEVTRVRQVGSHRLSHGTICGALIDDFNEIVGN